LCARVRDLQVAHDRLNLDASPGVHLSQFPLRIIDHSEADFNELSQGSGAQLGLWESSLSHPHSESLARLGLGVSYGVSSAHIEVIDIELLSQFLTRIADIGHTQDDTAAISVVAEHVLQQLDRTCSERRQAVPEGAGPDSFRGIARKFESLGLDCYADSINQMLNFYVLGSYPALKEYRYITAMLTAPFSPAQWHTECTGESHYQRMWDNLMSSYGTLAKFTLPEGMLAEIQKLMYDECKRALHKLDELNPEDHPQGDPQRRMCILAPTYTKIVKGILQRLEKPPTE
jgi:hypothetical protein